MSNSEDFLDGVAGIVSRRVSFFFKNASEDDIAVIANGCAADVRDEWGGAQLYIPLRLPAEKAAAREKPHRIYDDFTGTNFRELSMKYGLSERYVRTVISTVREERIKSQQRGNGPGPLLKEKQK